jgi:predicted ATPase
MPITFRIVSRGERPTDQDENTIFLVENNWDDYSFKTSFEMVVLGSGGWRLDAGGIKIGYVGQKEGWSKETMPQTFNELPPSWFSLGQDVDYYQKICEKLDPELASAILRALRDIVIDENQLLIAKDEPVFQTSLMRGVSFSVINGQYKRVLSGDALLTEFRFAYRDSGDSKRAPINLLFHVMPDSRPSTNVHVLIGRNGVGKTTLLNNMVGAVLAPIEKPEGRGQFYEVNGWGGEKSLPADYFSSLVSVSFSAFDPFIPPVDQPDRSKGVAYFYVGMKKTRSGNLGQVFQEPPKSDADLANDFIESLRSCLSQPAKRQRWKTAIERLESDENFAEMALGRVLEVEGEEVALGIARTLVGRMSSGHSIVLLTITKLVDAVEEKTLVLVDEPESHLHPPLLAAFTRALSDLLHNRNGVAIIATHSPVVAQEVPRICVWKLTRLRAEGRADRPERETFGENVGVLTREIFGLEVRKSGFHEMLERAVVAGGTFDSIYHEYKGQLGFEAQAIVRSLITARDSAAPPHQ